MRMVFFDNIGVGVYRQTTKGLGALSKLVRVTGVCLCINRFPCCFPKKHNHLSTSLHSRSECERMLNCVYELQKRLPVL